MLTPAVQDLSLLQKAGIALVLVGIYLVGQIVYRLFFSPIAHIPGPKIAAASFWYQFYWDVIKQGRYVWKIKELHELYGPIVRINPYEVHINDIEFYDQIYSSASKRRDKWSFTTKMFGENSGGFGTNPHDLHKIRRAPLLQFFSRASILTIAPQIIEKIDKLCSRLQEFRNTKEPVNMQHAYTALTVDVITEYCFANPNGSLDEPDLGRDWYRTLNEVTRLCHLNAQFPFLVPLMEMMPKALTPPHFQSYLKQIDLVSKQVDSVLSPDKAVSAKASYRTIFSSILESNLPASEKRRKRLIDEAIILVGAGSLTTAHVQTVATFYLVQEPERIQRLKAELLTVMPDPSKLPTLSELEKLPYFKQIYLETMRLTYGVIGRTQRIAPDEDLYHKGLIIPAGTPMSMSALLSHENPDVFPDPQAFKPERWADPEEERQLSRFLLNFSRGTRMCLGMELAKVEIYFGLAAVIRRFDFELFETDESDVRSVHDFFAPLAKLDSKGVRMFVK